MSIERIAEVLAQHRTVSVGQRSPGGEYEWRYECRYACGWRSEPFDPLDEATVDAAKRAALRHEAEQIVAAVPAAGEES